MWRTYWGVFIALLLGACGDVTESPRRVEYAAFLELDSELNPLEFETVQGATTFLSTRAINGSDVPAFSEVFGGNGSSDLIRFLSERVSYVISASTDFSDRVRVRSNFYEFASADSQAGVGATNLSFLWFIQKSIDPDQLYFEINRRFIEINSSRVGIVQLGPAILRVPQVVQAGILLHEARHSDCTGGLWQSDVNRLIRGEDPGNFSCGHLHVRCPPGHDFEGLFACDVDPWGAYSVNLLYYLALQRECSNCSEVERVIAQMASIDAASRLLFDVESMLAGNLGTPNMTSSDEVLNR